MESGPGGEGRPPFDLPDPPETGEEVAERPTPRPVPAEHRPSPRRRRHRDLPAKVRRRQAIALIVVVAAIGIGAYALFSGGGKSKPTVAQIPVSKLVGQTVVGKMGRSGADKGLLQRVRKGELGGVIVFPRSAASLRTDTAKLQKAAADGGNPPLMIAIDQEGGTVKRLPGPPTVSPAQLGKSGDADAAKEQGKSTGEYLSGLGVNVDFAPDADVTHAGTPKTLSSRTFGADAGEVSKLVVAFADGLKDGKTAATVKHFPGLGLATANTDTSAVTISTARPILEQDLAPFAAAVDAGVPLVMMSTAIYPSYGSKDPAAWSQPIIQNELRQKLSFDGVVITDDLEGAAVTSVLSPDKAAARALAAGADMVLFARGTGTSANAYKQLVKKTEAGKLQRATLEDAYQRITDLKDSFPGN
jgi:beta-N-acetylhexosaminidase